MTSWLPQGGPHLPGQVAARRLGADLALLEAQLYGRPQDACEHAALRGLRLDQAAAIWHVLTSSRTVEIVTGPAGTGKTRVLAAAAHAWGGPVFGTATSQNATNELRAAGVQVAANTTRLLADLIEGRIPPGSLITIDEGSMVSMAHLAALAGYAARNGCKLVLAGDQEQLAAVEGGGAMMLRCWPTGWGTCSWPSLSGSPPNGNAAPRCGCALATPPRWMSTTSAAASAAPRPTRRPTRPPGPTWPATWPGGTCC